MTQTHNWHLECPHSSRLEFTIFFFSTYFHAIQLGVLKRVFDSYKSYKRIKTLTSLWVWSCYMWSSPKAKENKEDQAENTGLCAPLNIVVIVDLKLCLSSHHVAVTRCIQCQQTTNNNTTNNDNSFPPYKRCPSFHCCFPNPMSHYIHSSHTRLL